MEAKSQSYVYKFLTSARTTYFIDSLLRFTQPNAQNDPFDSLPALTTGQLGSVALDMVAKLQSGVPLSTLGLRRPSNVPLKVATKKAIDTLTRLVTDDAAAAALFYSHHDKVVGDAAVMLCLSRRWNSSLMWAHYAESHTGFCLGFNREHPYFGPADGRAMSPLISVRYSENRIHAPVRDRFTPDEFADLLSTKSIEWQYEEEERMVDVLSNASEVIDAGPHKIALFKVPQDAVAEVILGARADREVTKSVVAAARALAVPVFRARVSRSRFDLERERM